MVGFAGRGEEPEPIGAPFLPQDLDRDRFLGHVPRAGLRLQLPGVLLKAGGRHHAHLAQLFAHGDSLRMANQHKRHPTVLALFEFSLLHHDGLFAVDHQIAE